MPNYPGFLGPPGDYPNRVLPSNAYSMTLNDLRIRFSDAFPQSTRRLMLCDGLEQWLHKVTGYGIDLTVWVDGSFVEDKVDPDDIDLWSFCDGAAFGNLDSKSRSEFMGLVSGRENTKQAYHCHTLCWVNFPKGHPLEFKNESARLEALGSWGQTRPLDKQTGIPYANRYPKGFIVLTVGAAPPSISTIGVWP